MRSKNRVIALLSTASLLAASAVFISAGTASAAAPTGGCWVYQPSDAGNIEDTVPEANLSSGYAAWGVNADYNLTTSGGSQVGDTRDFELTYNIGPTNGGPAASGTVYYYFSVNGVNLDPVSKAFSAPGFGSIPGDTVDGSFTVTSAGTNTVTLRKVIYDIPSFTLRVQCNGQEGSVPDGVNPATTPVDTNIVSTFSAIGATATITGISNQVVTTAARKGDEISFDLSNFSSAGTGTVQLCDATGSNCDADTGSVSIAAGGTGSGTFTVPAAATAGNRTLKVSSGSEASLTSITVLGNVTVATNVVGGGAGTVVTVSGTNWDPNQDVTVGGYVAGPPFPPGASSDPTVNTTADSTGNISASFVVNDPATAYIGANTMHGTTALFGSKAFTFSGDGCTAKVGAATTGSCDLLETVDLTVVGGDLKMSKDAGNISMESVTLDGTEQTSAGDLQDVTVKDYRGGTLGWSLVGSFGGLTGPANPNGGNFTIGADALSWTPSCAPAANSDDTVVAGAAGSFAAAEAMPLCSVATSGLGADGTSGGDAVADAGLEIAVGASQAAGNYTGLLTLTLS